MWEPAAKLRVSKAQQEILNTWIRAPTTLQRTVLRSHIVLAAAEGRANHAIAKQLGVSRPTVLLWRQRFAEEGPTGAGVDVGANSSNFAARVAWVVPRVPRSIAVYIDAGESAKSLDRAGLNAALEAVEAGPADASISIERSSRPNRS